MRIPSPLRGIGIVGALVLGPAVAAVGAEAERPNVVIIMTDDQGWGDLGAHGNTWVKTPVLDGLAAEAVSFDRFYVSPVCSPTRAALLTGRWPLRAGVTGVARGREVMRTEETTIAELFRDAGYATGCFGKWHNGAHYPQDPNGQGFREFFGFCGGHMSDYFDPLLERNGKAVRTKGYIADVITDAAIAFIRSHRREPFLCYVPFNTPHAPLQVPDAEYDRYRALGLDESTSAIYGMCENVDTNVGRLLAALDAQKLRERTIVVFLTDNGPSTARFNGGMKGIKADLNEGSTRVPLMIRWPGHLHGASVAQIAADIDVLPTLLELCGVSRPSSLKLDGMSLAPLLRGEDAGWPERMLFVHLPIEGKVGLGGCAVRTQQYRLVRPAPGKEWELYDMTADPTQSRDEAAANPAEVGRLSGAYDRWLADVSNPRPEVPPIPLGFPEEKTVSLATTEGTLGGQLRYANELGWTDDWATSWTSPDDRITWDVDVVRAGRYAVSIVLAAPPEAVGTVLLVSAGADTCRAPIRKSFDPPVERRPDRDPHATRTVRRFEEMKLGTLALPKGRMHLTLQAVAPTGAHIADVQSLRLRYLGS